MIILNNSKHKKYILKKYILVEIDQYYYNVIMVLILY